MSSTEVKDAVLSFDRFALSLRERLLTEDGQIRHLTPRVFDLLAVLVRTPGEVVTKEQLLEAVWAGVAVEEGNINRTVSTLRKQLGKQTNGNDFIETVPKVGYRFLPPVAVSNGDSGSTRPRRNASLKWLFVGVLLVIAAAGVGAALYVRRGASRQAERTDKNVPIRLTTSDVDEANPVFTSDGRIRFTRGSGAAAQTFVMSPDEPSNAVPETAMATAKIAYWSPDGSRVLFHKTGDAKTTYIAKADGSEEVMLPFRLGNFQWSADGSKLLYQSSVKREDGILDSNIYIYDAATGTSKAVVESPFFDGDPSLSPDGGTIAFVSDRDGNIEVYSMVLATGVITRLTFDPAHDSFPTFSPDGTQIAFNSARTREDTDLFLMNADGSGVRQFTDLPSNESIRSNCWSPDGTQILFISDGNGKDNIFLISVEPFAVTRKFADAENDVAVAVAVPGSDAIAVVERTSNETSEIRIIGETPGSQRTLVKLSTPTSAIAVSPDGQTIAYADRVNGNHDIFSIPLKGGEARNLTTHPNSDIAPAWSPDGERIVFASNRGENRAANGIYSMKYDGSDVKLLYFANSNATWLRYSPDGRVIFADDKIGGKIGNFEIFTIDGRTGGDERRLTVRPRYDDAPAVSPDGKRVVFVSQQDGNSEIYLMDIDGSRIIRITRDTAVDNWPSWSNDGREIYFSSDRGGKYAMYSVAVD